MKFKNSLKVLLIGIIAMSMVACSEPKTKKVESGSAAPVEEKKDAPAEEIVLIDDDLAKVVVTEKTDDEIFGPTYKFSAENKSDKKIIIQTRDTSIDGTMEDPLFSLEVMPGKKAKGDMTFSNIKELEGLKNLEGKLIICGEDFMEIQSYDMKVK